MAKRRRVSDSGPADWIFSAGWILKTLENEFRDVLRKAGLPDRNAPIAVTWRRDGPDWRYLVKRGDPLRPGEEKLEDVGWLVTELPDSPEFYAAYGLRSIKDCRAALRKGNPEAASVAMARAVQRAARADIPTPDLTRAEAAFGRKVKAGLARGAPAGGRTRGANIADDHVHRGIKNLGNSLAAKQPTWSRQRIAKEIAPNARLSVRQVERVLQQHGIPGRDM